MSKKNHKYLNKIGISSDEIAIFNTRNIDTDKDRQKKFLKEREKYGHDSRETWALNYTSATWLYSHLKMYRKMGGKIVDLTFYKIDIPVLEKIPKNELEFSTNNPDIAKEYYRKQTRNVSQLEAIKIIEKYLKYAMLHFDDMDKKAVKAYEKAACAFEIYGIIFPTMWW